jgi:3-phenylpropionate/trans-cinnamate dioxygenase ferredoxin reductase component
MEHASYVIVGGGLAAVAAADALRRRDKAGRIVIISNEPHPPYDRVPLSKDYLLGHIERDDIFLRRARFYERSKVELMLSQPVTALELDQHRVVLASGDRVSFDKLLLATGGRPRRLPIPGDEMNGVFYLRNVEDTEAIQKAVEGARRAVVVGGGFIGCELACAFTKLGLHTTVVELTPAVLSLAIDAETSQFIESYLRQQGVHVLTEIGAARFEGDNGQVVAVVTHTGERLEADIVAVGVGIIPNTELAAEAGLNVDNGVIVNEYLEAAENVYVAGDIARYYSPTMGRHVRVEHYDVAMQHGRTAAVNMTGERQAYTELPYFFSTMSDINLNVIGDMGKREHCVRRGPLSLDPGFAQFYFAEGLLQAVLTVNRDGSWLQAAKARILTGQPVADPKAFADESKEIASL